MKKPLTFSVVIPALNEGKNIRHLLTEILAEKAEPYILEKIIICSDGSTDNTVAEAKSLKDKRVLVLESKFRQGVAKSQNLLFKTCQSDIAILLNGDVRLKRNCLLNLLNGMTKNKADLSAGDLIPSRPNSLVNEALALGMKFKSEIFANLNNGNNIGSCHGAIRAFSKRFYKRIKFNKSVGEDAYSYLLCKELGFTYYYEKSAMVLLSLPATLSEHFRQSQRFFELSSESFTDISEKTVTKELVWPINKYVSTCFKYLLLHPITMSIYIGITAISFLKNYRKTSHDLWDQVPSTKTIPAYAAY